MFGFRMKVQTEPIFAPSICFKLPGAVYPGSGRFYRVSRNRGVKHFTSAKFLPVAARVRFRTREPGSRVTGRDSVCRL